MFCFLIKLSLSASFLSNDSDKIFSIPSNAILSIVFAIISTKIACAISFNVALNSFPKTIVSANAFETLLTP